MPAAARVGDLHTCPMAEGAKPHVGGPVASPGVATVLIGGLPAAVAGTTATCAGPPDAISGGSSSVFIGGAAAARAGDATAHGGLITSGCPTVSIGDQETTDIANGDGGGSSSLATVVAVSQALGAADAAAEATPPLDSKQAASLAEAAQEGVATVDACEEQS